jgi:transcriptional repressor NrdR
MRCPYCGYRSRVIDSRDAEEGIRRRRECLQCQARFTTYERAQQTNVYVKKKDNRREQFDRQKVLNGVRRACEKRPLPTNAIDKLVDDIEGEVHRLGRPEVESRLIGDMVMRRLRELDHIAYIRFASVYRDFTDITALKREVDTLLDKETRIAPAAQLPLIPDEEIEIVAGGRGFDNE